MMFRKKRLKNMNSGKVNISSPFFKMNTPFCEIHKCLASFAIYPLRVDHQRHQDCLSGQAILQDPDSQY